MKSFLEKKFWAIFGRALSWTGFLKMKKRAKKKRSDSNTCFYYYEGEQKFEKFENSKTSNWSSGSLERLEKELENFSRVVQVLRSLAKVTL